MEELIDTITREVLSLLKTRSLGSNPSVLSSSLQPQAKRSGVCVFDGVVSPEFTRSWGQAGQGWFALGASIPKGFQPWQGPVSGNALSEKVPRVFIASFRAQSLARIALMTGGCSVSDFVIESLVYGIPVYISLEALTFFRRFEAQLSKGVVTKLNRYVTELEELGASVVSVPEFFGLNTGVLSLKTEENSRTQRDVITKDDVTRVAQEGGHRIAVGHDAIVTSLAWSEAKKLKVEIVKQ